MDPDEPSAPDSLLSHHLGKIGEDIHEIRRTQVVLRWVIIVIIGLYAGGAALLLVGGVLIATFSDSSEPPVRYEVTLADNAAADVTVSYLDPTNGERVTMQVVTPWESQEWQTSSDTDLLLSARLDGEQADGLVCRIVAEEYSSRVTETRSTSASCELERAVRDDSNEP